jgi:ParB/RepB/Spo0J family partition protein
MDKYITVNPFQCRMWGEHERLEEHITEESCRAEIQSFREHGQQVPVLGRLVKNDPMCQVELIYGARRLFVARHLNLMLTVEIREVSDQQAAIAMDLENRQRKDISAYERALCYTRWLRANVFQSQDEIAKALRIAPSQVSRMLKLVRLPSVVVNAFGSPLEIREVWGLELSRLVEDPGNQRLLIQRARAIAAESTRPHAEAVFQRLIGQKQRGRKEQAASHDEVVKDAGGRPLFRVRYYRKHVAIMLDTERHSKESLEYVKALVSQALQSSPRDSASLLTRSFESASKRLLGPPGREMIPARLREDRTAVL